jgi:hypothetical protein
MIDEIIALFGETYQWGIFRTVNIISLSCTRDASSS